MRVNISFRTLTDISSNRIVEISDAFGLGLDEEKVFNIYNDIEVDIRPNDIVYITGDSGSGKSLLIRELKTFYGDRATDLQGVDIRPTDLLIESLGNTSERAIELLSQVGLNDAYIFLRKYEELSDGQKYRYRIAKAIELDKDIWICDEFCSILDRDTAKIVSFNLQKEARKRGKIVIAATSHQDLIEDLNPTLYIRKGFEDEITINRYDYVPNKLCSIVKDLYIEQMSKAAIKDLLKFHYKNKNVGFVRKIYGLFREPMHWCIGCIVYTYPKLKLYGRNRVFPKRFLKETGAPDMKKANAEIALISRVVIHPKYRNLGLGYYLVRETLNRVGTPIVEAIATMGKYTPFFDKAGMTRFEEQDQVKDNPYFTRIKERLVAVGVDVRKLNSTKYCIGKLDSLSQEDLLKLKEALLRSRRLDAFGKSGSSNRVSRQEFLDMSVEETAIYLRKAIPKSMYYWYWIKGEKDGL